MSKEYVLVKVSGPDQPGITSKLMNVIVQSDCNIADMGQSVTHGLLSLSILLELNTDKKDYPVIKDLLFEAKKMGMALDFDLIEDKKDSSLEESKGERFILNCVSSSTISATFLKDIANTLAENNVNILRIDSIGEDSFKALEFTTVIPKSQSTNFNKIKEELMLLSGNHEVDVAFIKDNVWRRNKRLIVFDMDSTLIQTEVIDEMGEVFGVGEEIRKITESAMNGEIDFDESLKQRVGSLKGLEESKLKEILERIPFTPGVPEFIKTVKGLGFKVAVISGGFTFFANALKEKLGLDFAFANELEIENGKLTGNIKGSIVNAQQKAFLVNLIAQQLQINMEQVVAIGDGANDLPMLSAAGLGIAYHAKPIVKEKAGQHMSHGPMTTILHFLGIPDADS